MKSYERPEKRRNYFFPNCGCKSEADCITCPHCGMCVAHTESCDCGTLPVGADIALRFDPHLEILGG